MSEAMEPEILLDVLGNETRRRILRLLADEPKYFNQLARELRVSQQAVLKHLEILGQHGLVSSFRAKSELAAPDRKYYKLGRGLHLSVGIAGGLVDMDLQELKERAGLKVPQGLIELYEHVKESEEIEDKAEFVSASREIIRKIDERLDNLADAKVALLGLRQVVMGKVHEVAQETFEGDLHRRILYWVLGSDRTINIEELSELLDAREREVREAIRELERTLQLRIARR